MADPIREALERLVSAYDSNEGLPIAEWIAAARAALEAAPPEMPEPTHEQIAQWINANPVLRPGATGGPAIRVGTDWLAAFADAARWGAQFRPPTPPTPAAGEVAELVEHLRAELRGFHPRHRVFGELTIARLTRIAALLEQFSAAQALQPVPVSERLPGPEDCDAEGRCWFFDPCAGGWWWLRPALIIDSDPEPLTHWLPAHALPIPREEVE